jgi:hypothetical protein
MQPGNKFFDDMGKLMTNAMGVAQGAKTEMETAMKSFFDRWISSRVRSSMRSAPWRKKRVRKTWAWRRALRCLRPS